MKEQSDHSWNLGLVENAGGIEMKQVDDTQNVLRESDNWQSKSNVNSSTTCEYHDTVLLYCADCNFVVCGQCEKRHSTHQQMKLSDASKLNKTLMNAEVIQIKNLIRYSNIVIKDLTSYLEKLSASLADITSQMFGRAADLPEHQDLLAETVLGDIQLEHDQESNRIRDKITEFDQFIAAAKTKVLTIENLTNTVEDKFVILKGNSVLKSAQTLMKALPVCPKERYMYVLAPLATEESKCYTPEEIVGQFAKVKVPWRIEVKRTGSFRPESVSSRFVTTMCPTDDGKVWVVWQWGTQVHLVDKEGAVLKSVDLGCRVDDICKHNGNLVVSSHDSKCIKFLDQNQEIIKTIETDKVPRGVYSLSNKEVVACCVQNLHHKNGDTSSILKVNVGSGNVQELPCSEHLIQPWRMTVNVNGDICVSDRNKGCVMIFDAEGTLKATYSGPETSTRHPFAPHAICCDQHGQIYVVDYSNHTVHVLDPYGRFRGFLIMDTELEKRAIFMGTSSPFSITIDSAGDVWVGNKFGYLTVLTQVV